MHVSLCFLNNTWTNSEYNFTIIIASNIHDCYIMFFLLIKYTTYCSFLVEKRPKVVKVDSNCGTASKVFSDVRLTMSAALVEMAS